MVGWCSMGTFNDPCLWFPETCYSFVAEAADVCTRAEAMLSAVHGGRRTVLPYAEAWAANPWSGHSSQPRQERPSVPLISLQFWASWAWVKNDVFHLPYGGEHPYLSASAVLICQPWYSLDFDPRIHTHIIPYIFLLTEFLPSSKTHRFWWGGVGWGGMLTFICTSTHTWCYATACSSATSTQMWCYATARSSATSTQTWCYATACSSATSTHTWCYVGVGWGGMLTFIGTSTSTWCYASARSSATSTQTWCYATACSSATSKQTWCYATACSSATSTHTAYIKQLSWFDFGPLEEKKRWEACRWKS